MDLSKFIAYSGAFLILFGFFLFIFGGMRCCMNKPLGRLFRFITCSKKPDHSIPPPFEEEGKKSKSLIMRCIRYTFMRKNPIIQVFYYHLS